MAVDEKQDQILRKKAKRKFISNSLAAKLCAVGGDEWQIKYRKTFSCCHVLEADHEDIRSMFYCKKRWCQTCQAISMATQINNYLPIFEKLKSNNTLYFVTLTRPTVKASDLNQRIDEMGSAWRKITDLARKKKYTDYQGIKKLECKISTGSKQYHPHYHLIVTGENNAKFIVANWLRLNKDSSKNAQKIDEIWDTEEGLKELFKYTVKLSTGDKRRKKQLNDETGEITWVEVEQEKPMTPSELNIIFKALYKRRVFQSFGSIRKCNDEDFAIERANLKAAAGYYYWAGSDWYHEDYGHPLANYNPTAEDMVYL